MARLLSFTASTIIQEYGHQGSWPGGHFRARVVDLWLDKHNHRASTLKKSKLALHADAVARMLVAGTCNALELLTSPDEEVRTDIRLALLEASRSMLLMKNVTA